MRDTLIRRLRRQLRPGGDHVERCVPDTHSDIYFAFLAMYRFARRFARGKRVLDAGCGTGYGDLHLCEHGAAEVTGVDVSRRAIAYARAHFTHPHLRFECIAENRFPFPDDSFDVVFSSNVIEHVADHQTHLREIRRVLAPGGVLILITPVVEVSGESAHPHHCTNLTPEQWHTTLAPLFPAVQTCGVYLRAFPQHALPWALSPLVQWLAVHPMCQHMDKAIRDRIDHDLIFNPFGLWEGDFEVEPCEPTTRAMNSSMTFLAVCGDEPIASDTLTMQREPRVWSEDDLNLARLWRDLRRAFASHCALFPAPEGDDSTYPPEDIVWRPPAEIWGARRVRETFTAPEGSIIGLRLCFATFARRNTGTVNLRLLDESGGELAAAEIACEELQDGGMHTVLFPAPVRGHGGRRLAFEVSSDTATMGNAVTVWTRYDCSKFEPGMSLADARGAWGGAVFEVISE